VCGSANLSPLAELRSENSGANPLRLVFKRPGRLRLRPYFDVDFARACLDCGSVLTFIGEGTRRRIEEVRDLPDVVDWTDRRLDGDEFEGDEDRERWLDDEQPAGG
jgi:hypothetical protein